MNEQIEPEALIPHLTREYAVGLPIACSLIRRGFNDTYLVAAADRKLVFRVYFRDKYYIGGEGDFRWEVGLLAHLKGSGLPVCAAIPRRNGELLGSIADCADDRSCALFPFVEGEPPPKAFTDERARDLGAIIARLHQAADSYETTNPRYEFDLRYLAEQPLQLMDIFLKENGRAGVHKFLPAVAAVEAKISAIGRDTPVFGPIHGDLHRGNILATDDGNLTFIDFDHAGYGWRAYDLASCTGGMAEPVWHAVLAGYEAVRPLSRAEHDAIDAFRTIRPVWDMGDVLAMRKAWDNHAEFGAEFADKIEAMLESRFGGGARGE